MVSLKTRARLTCSRKTAGDSLRSLRASMLSSKGLVEAPVEAAQQQDTRERARIELDDVHLRERERIEGNQRGAQSKSAYEEKSATL